MIIKNIDKGTVISSDCLVADNFASRFMGLMGKKELSPGGGLLIRPCNSIHMCFMRFPLDIIFIDKANKVVNLIEGIKPWRVTSVIRHAYSTIELPVGTIKGSNTQVGDPLLLEGDVS